MRDAPARRTLRHGQRLHPRGQAQERRDLPLRRRRLGARRHQHGARARAIRARSSSASTSASTSPAWARPRRAPDAPCQMIAADFETLSHQMQKQIGMSEYHVPVLVGYSSGATVVYATLVQSPPGTFAGALSLGFCADQDFAGAQPVPGRRPALHARTRSTSWCSSRRDASSSRGSPSRARRIRCATRTRRMSSPPQVANGADRAAAARRPRLLGRAQLDAAVPRRLRAPRCAPPEARAGAAPPDIGDLPVQEVHASGHVRGVRAAPDRGRRLGRA